LPWGGRAAGGGHPPSGEGAAPQARRKHGAGPGRRELGRNLVRRWDAPGQAGPRSAHVLLSHPHLDHISATPLFDPYFEPANHFTLHAPPSALTSLETLLSPASPLSTLYFPLTFESLKALRDRRPLPAGADFFLGSTRVRTFALRHPGGCLAFRLENAGRAFVFATDHEHAEVPDRTLAGFARDADLLYLDGQYLAAEYEGRVGIMGERPLARVGWGHSPIEACVATAVAAGARRLHVGHREPKRDDADLVRVEGVLKEGMAAALRAAGLPPDACAASIPYEGLTVRL
jgi:phosphoribosyl 1,2-cyclic phosphodiesterase